MKVLLCVGCMALHVKSLTILSDMKCLGTIIWWRLTRYWFSFMRTINTMSFLLAFCVDNKQLFFCHRQVSHIGHHHMVNVRDQSTQLDITITFPFLPFNISTIIETISSCGGILLLKTQRFLLAKAK